MDSRSGVSDLSLALIEEHLSIDESGGAELAPKGELRLVEVIADVRATTGLGTGSAVSTGG